MSIIDTKVYSKNQVFLIVELWKFTDTPTKDDVLHFQPEREHCMTNLLSTLVSNVRGVTIWLSEYNDAQICLTTSVDHVEVNLVFVEPRYEVLDLGRES